VDEVLRQAREKEACPKERFFLTSDKRCQECPNFPICKANHTHYQGNVNFDRFDRVEVLRQSREEEAVRRKMSADEICASIKSFSRHSTICVSCHHYQSCGNEQDQQSRYNYRGKVNFSTPQEIVENFRRETPKDIFSRMGVNMKFKGFNFGPID